MNKILQQFRKEKTTHLSLDMMQFNVTTKKYNKFLTDDEKLDAQVRTNSLSFILRTSFKANPPRKSVFMSDFPTSCFHVRLSNFSFFPTTRIALKPFISELRKLKLNGFVGSTGKNLEDTVDDLWKDCLSCSLMMAYRNNAG